MSAHLERVAQLAEQRAAHMHALHALEPQWRRALKAAHKHHGLREIARHAGITHAGVAYIIREEKP